MSRADTERFFDDPEAAKSGGAFAGQKIAAGDLSHSTLTDYEPKESISKDPEQMIDEWRFQVKAL